MNELEITVDSCGTCPFYKVDREVDYFFAKCRVSSNILWNSFSKDESVLSYSEFREERETRAFPDKCPMSVGSPVVVKAGI